MNMNGAIVRRTTTVLVAVGLLATISACGLADEPTLEDELDHVAANVMRHEELIAGCMAGKGWEYIPAMPADMLLERESVLAEAEGREFDPDSVDVPDNPNDAIVAGLTDQEKDARADAYWGNLETGGTDEGCYYSTYEEAWGVDMASFDDETLAKLEEVDAAVAADPRIIAAQGEYIACMGEQGYQVTSLDDIFRQYDVGREQLAAELQSQGYEDPEQSAEMQQYRTEMNAAYQTHSECEPAYREVENTVRGEKLREAGI